MASCVSVNMAYLLGSIERMAFVGRQAIGADLGRVSVALDDLLGRVVAGSAAGGPVRLVPEQALVAAMRSDVVDDARGGAASLLGADHAPRMGLEVGGPRLLPGPRIATLAGCGAHGGAPVRRRRVT